MVGIRERGQVTAEAIQIFFNEYIKKSLSLTQWL